MRNVAARVVKLAAAGRDTIVPARPGAVVLGYHRVGGRSGLTIDLPKPLFRAQLDELAGEGRLVSLSSLLETVSKPHTPAVQPVALTFDDGTADFADVVMPLLVEAKAPVTLYVATEFIEEGRSFPHGGVPLSWPALRDALSTGLLTVGSHTHAHLLLDRLGADTVSADLDCSIKLIEDRLGVAPEHFAYPKAVLGSHAAQEAIRRRFHSAAIAGTRANPYGSTDPYRLNRSPVQVTDGMTWFRRKARGGMALEDDLRRLANRRRYARAVT